MKRCAQCGKEYPDEVLVCAIDQQPLQQVVSSPPAQAPLPAKSHKKSDFISLETMLIWAIVAVVILFIVGYILLFGFGLERDHAF
ncbi:MAG TPA: hypothetical protein VGM58_08385 [Verrucomicrobiae bacterium]|jgi:uncharacterized membrane protein YvbJ